MNDRRQQAGFTLIGILLAVAIVGILLVMSMQNYKPVLTNFQTGTPGRESFKLDISKSQLSKLQEMEVLYYSVHNSYATWDQLVKDGDIAQGYSAKATDRTPFIPYYDIDIQTSQTGFVITATPSYAAGAPVGTSTLKIDENGNVEEVPTK